MPTLGSRITATVFTFGIAVMALAGCTADTAPSVDGEHSVTEVEVEFGVGTTTFTDGTLTSPHLRITITESKLLQPGEPGNEYGEAAVLAIWYDTTNVSGQEVNPLSAWFTHFRAVQDQGDGTLPVELTLGMTPEAELAELQSSAIPEGDTVRSAVAYTLLDLETPVELVASDAVLNQVGSSVIALN